MGFGTFVGLVVMIYSEAFVDFGRYLPRLRLHVRALVWVNGLGLVRWVNFFLIRLF